MGEQRVLVSLRGHEHIVTPTEQATLDLAAKRPLDVDISDYGDEWCAGFLRGQVNAIEYILVTGADLPADARCLAEIDRLRAVLAELQSWVARWTYGDRTAFLGPRCMCLSLPQQLHTSNCSVPRLLSPRAATEDTAEPSA